MKILWFVDKLFDAALDKATWLETAKYLQRDHEVQLVSGFKTTRAQFPELENEIIYLPSPRVRFLRRLGQYGRQVAILEKLVLSFCPTVLLFNTNNFLLLRRAARLREKHGVRLYLDLRTLPVSPRKSEIGLERILFAASLKTAARDFDGVSYITRGLRDYCEKWLRLPPHRSAVWSSGVDPQLFRPRPKPLQGRTFVLLYHGRVASNRGLQGAVKAMAAIRDRDVELVIMGDGDGLPRLRRLASSLSLRTRVTFRPPVPLHEVPEQIGKADAGLLPFPDWAGWNTSSPIKLFEYLACGKPVIVTRIPAHLEVLDGQPFAFWAETSTPEALGRAILEARDSLDRFPVLGGSAREFAAGRFSWERQAGELEKLLLGGGERLG